MVTAALETAQAGCTAPLQEALRYSIVPTMCTAPLQEALRYSIVPAMCTAPLQEALRYSIVPAMCTAPLPEALRYSVYIFIYSHMGLRVFYNFFDTKKIRINTKIIAAQPCASTRSDCSPVRRACLEADLLLDLA